MQFIGSLGVIFLFPLPKMPCQLAFFAANSMFLLALVAEVCPIKFWRGKKILVRFSSYLLLLSYYMCTLLASKFSKVRTNPAYRI